MGAVLSLFCSLLLTLQPPAITGDGLPWRQSIYLLRKGSSVSKLEACSDPHMVSVEPILSAFDVVAVELNLHCHHLSNDQLDALEEQALVVQRR